MKLEPVEGNPFSADFTGSQTVEKKSSGTTSIDSIKGALAKVETGGHPNPYVARNPKSTAYGKYQIIKDTWSEWGGKYLGNKNAPKTRKNQEAIATARVKDLLDQGFSEEEIAKSWYGHPNPAENEKYAGKVMQALGKTPSIKQPVSGVKVKLEPVEGNPFGSSVQPEPSQDQQPSFMSDVVGKTLKESVRPVANLAASFALLPAQGYEQLETAITGKSAQVVQTGKLMDLMGLSPQSENEKAGMEAGGKVFEIPRKIAQPIGEFLGMGTVAEPIISTLAELGLFGLAGKTKLGGRTIPKPPPGGGGGGGTPALPPDAARVISGMRDNVAVQQKPSPLDVTGNRIPLQKGRPDLAGEKLPTIPLQYGKPEVALPSDLPKIEASVPKMQSGIPKAAELPKPPFKDFPGVREYLPKMNEVVAGDFLEKRQILLNRGKELNSLIEDARVRKSPQSEISALLDEQAIVANDAQLFNEAVNTFRSGGKGGIKGEVNVAKGAEFSLQPGEFERLQQLDRMGVKDPREIQRIILEERSGKEGVIPSAPKQPKAKQPKQVVSDTPFISFVQSKNGMNHKVNPGEVQGLSAKETGRRMLSNKKSKYDADQMLEMAMQDPELRAKLPENPTPSDLFVAIENEISRKKKPVASELSPEGQALADMYGLSPEEAALFNVAEEKRQLGLPINDQEQLVLKNVQKKKKGLPPGKQQSLFNIQREMPDTAIKGKGEFAGDEGLFKKPEPKEQASFLTPEGEVSGELSRPPGGLPEGRGARTIPDEIQQKAKDLVESRTKEEINQKLNDITGEMSDGRFAEIRDADGLPPTPEEQRIFSLQSRYRADLERAAIDRDLPETANILNHVERVKARLEPRTIRDVISDINTSIGEKGAVGRLGKKTPEQLAAEQRLREDVQNIKAAAEKAGKEFGQFLKDNKFSEEDIKIFVETARYFDAQAEKQAPQAPIPTTQKAAEGTDYVKRDSTFKRFWKSDLMDMVRGKSGAPEGIAEQRRESLGGANYLTDEAYNKSLDIKNTIEKTKDKQLSDVADSALKGDKEALKSLPKDVHDRIVSVKSDIQTLVNSLADEIEQAVSPGQKISQNLEIGLDTEYLGYGNLIPPAELVRKMRSNKDYVARNYWINFDNKYHPSPSAWEGAIKGILKDDKLYKHITTREEAINHLKYLLDRKNWKSIDGTNQITIRQNHYLTRTNIPGYLRDFLGEIKDPQVNAFLTMRDLSKNMMQMRMFRELAKNKEMFSDTPVGDKQQLVSGFVDSHHYKWGAIADKYVNKEVGDFLADTRKMENAYDSAFSKALNIAKSLKVTWNPTTHIRNALGDIEFSLLARNSFLNPINLPNYYKAIKGMSGRDPALRKLLIQNHIIKNEYAHSELINMMDEMQKLARGHDSALTRPVKKAHKFMGNLYAIPDQLFKAAAFVKYIEKEGMTPRQATSEVYKYFQNYDEVSKFAKGIRESKAQILAPFLSFNSESMRIISGAIRRGGKDKAKAYTLMGWRSGYNLARLVAAGYTIDKALEYMYKNNLFFSSLLTEQKSKGSFNAVGQRGISPFNLNELYNPASYFWGGNRADIITGTIREAISDRDKYGKERTLPQSIGAGIGQINTMAGAVIDAVNAKKGKKGKAFISRMNPAPLYETSRTGSKRR